MAETIINVPFDDCRIIEAIDRAKNITHKKSLIYGDGDASTKMVSVIKRVLSEKIDLKKGFYDLEAGNS